MTGSQDNGEGMVSEKATEIRDDFPSGFDTGNGTDWQESGNVTDPPPSIKQLAAQSMWYKVGRYIQTICVPIFVAIGLVGNTLSFIVMIQPQNRRISCCIYMATVAVCDSGLLLVVINYWSTTDGIKVLWTDQQCKIAGYFFSNFAMISVVLVTFVTVDRFIAVRYPLRARAYCTPSRGKKIVAGIIVLVSICQLPHLRYFAQNGRTCQGFGFSDNWAVVFVWFNTALNSLIPFAIISVLNGFIVMTIRNRGKAFGQDGVSSGGWEAEGGNNKEEGKMGGRDRQLVTMLLLVTTALVVFTMPQCVRYIAYLFIDYQNDPTSFAIYFFWYNFCGKWFYINYSINFFLYCLGGQKFRDDLRKFFCRSKN